MERIAHRGAKRELPENTLTAFARAYDRGANAVELDVHTTADGVVVVHHDPWIGGNRLTGRKIAELESKELADFDLGGGARVPLLSAVLAATPATATVYVEIKGVGIERAVVETIRAGSARCAIHSFDHDAVARVRELAPEIPRGVLFEDRNITIVNIIDVVRVTDARDVWPKWDLIDAELVERVHGVKGRVIAWTVNSATDAKRLASIGVDGLCGDDVRLFVDGL